MSGEEKFRYQASSIFHRLSVSTLRGAERSDALDESDVLNELVPGIAAQGTRRVLE